MIGGRQLGSWLRYDRAEILSGEIWRVLSAHLMHLGWKHLMMNLVGLGLIWMLFGRAYSTAKWVFVVATSMLGVSLALLALMPSIQWYVGMSGILHGLFIAGAVANLAAGYRAELLLIGLLIVKLAWEHAYGALPGSESFAGGNVLVESHLFGAIAGLTAAVVLLLWKPQRSSGRTQS